MKNLATLTLLGVASLLLATPAALAGGGYVEYGPTGQTPYIVVIDSTTPAQPSDCFTYAGGYFHGIARQSWAIDKTNATSYVKTSVPFTYNTISALPGNTANCATTITSIAFTANTTSSRVGTASGTFTCNHNDYFNVPMTVTGRVSLQFDFNTKVGFTKSTEITNPVTVNGVVHQCTTVSRSATLPIQNGF